MRALIVNHRYFPFRGGSEIYVQTLAEWLARAGWDVIVITTDAYDLEYFWEPGARSVSADACELIGGAWVKRLPVRHRRGGRYTFGAVRRGMGEASRVLRWPAPFEHLSRFVPAIDGLADALVAAKPDVIVATNLGIEGLAVVARQAADQLGVPFVMVPFAHLGDGQRNTARRYVSMPHHRKLLRESDLVLAMTPLEAEFVADCGASGSCIAAVGAGISLTEVVGGDPRRLELLFGADSFTVATIGALAADKGTPDLVEASKLLRDRGTAIELILVGPELSAFRGWLKQRGADAWPWVHLAGTIDDSAKRDLLAGIDVLALPSRTESFGIVFLEAWANRKPVVAAGVGAVNQIVEDGVDGLLVPFGDASVLADALERLADSPKLRERMGIAGRRKVEAQYTWDRVLESIGRAFEEVLGLQIEAGRGTTGGDATRC